ncbi:MAG: DUF4387 domain-containing protein [Trueperaceae bacterium]
MAKLIRSKNAGPFVLTIDVMFDARESFDAVVVSGVLNANMLAQMFGVAPDDVAVYVVAPALAIKISLPRPVPSGAIEDSDIFGGQQYAPLVELEVPA